MLVGFQQQWLNFDIPGQLKRLLHRKRIKFVSFMIYLRCKFPELSNTNIVPILGPRHILTNFF